MAAGFLSLKRRKENWGWSSTTYPTPLTVILSSENIPPETR
jgi:hypothetical protein